MNKFLFFASIPEKLGAAELSIEATGKTIGQLKSELVTQYPQAEKEFSTALFAANEAFVNDEYHVQAGDIIAVMPPVSGG